MNIRIIDIQDNNILSAYLSHTSTSHALNYSPASLSMLVPLGTIGVTTLDQWQWNDSVAITVCQFIVWLQQPFAPLLVRHAVFEFLVAVAEKMSRCYSALEAIDVNLRYINPPLDYFAWWAACSWQIFAAGLTHLESSDDIIWHIAFCILPPDSHSTAQQT